MTHRQHGFTLTGIVLALTVASIILAATLPAWLRANTTIEQTNEIERAIIDVTSHVDDAIAAHISTSHCLSPPTVNINHLPLQPETRVALPHLALAFTTSQHVLLNYQIRFDLTNTDVANAVMQSLSTHQRWITRLNQQLTVTTPVNINDSVQQTLHLTPNTGCYER